MTAAPESVAGTTDVRQVVMTRINLNRGFGDGRAVDPRWIDRTLDLFELTALPSMRAQTAVGWRWLLLSTVDTPAAQRDRLDSYSDGATKVAYIDGYGRGVFSPLVAALTHGATVVTTTRLDSDDVIAPDFLATVKAVASSRAGTYFVNLDDGLRLAVATGAAYRYRHTSNMFLTLVEPGSADPETVLATQHQDAAEHHDVVHVTGRARWIQVIHEGNHSSALQRHRRVRKASVLHDFRAPVLSEAPPDRPTSVAVDLARYAVHRVAGRARSIVGPNAR